MTFLFRIVLVLSLAFIATEGLVVSAAEVVIKGLSEDQTEQINETYQPRLEYIKGRKATSWRADDAAFFLKRILVRRGYFQAAIDPQLPGNNLIQLDVALGNRFKFGEILPVEESVISNELIKEYYLQPLVDTEAVRIDDAPYIVEYKEKGARNVENYLKSLGYWNASVQNFSESMTFGTKRVNSNLEIIPGKLLQLERIKFVGGKVENISLLEPNIQVRAGRTASSKLINRVKRAVEQYYETNGYQFAKVEMDVEHSDTTTQLTFTIDSGAQYRVGDLTVTGYEKTQKRKVRRYFGNQKGEYYNEKEIDRITTKLIETGAFSSVVVEPVPNDEGLVDLEIKVTEAKARTFQSYAGFGSYEGGIIGAGFSDSNFYGSLIKFYTGAEVSGRGVLGQVGISVQRVFNSPLDFNARTFLVERFNEGYDIRKTGLETNLIWAPDNHYRTRLYWNGEYGDITDTDFTSDELGADNYFISRFGIEQTFDFRDDRLLPKNGFHTRLQLEGGVLSSGDSNSFIRTDLESSYRYHIDKKNQLLARFRVSTLHVNNDSVLPVDTRLFSGGVNSQRAYEQRELGPQSFSRDPLGGEAYWVGSLEFIRPILDPLQAVVFLDAGQLYGDISELSFDDPNFAAGLGLRIDLPIGPVRLEYGYNLNRDEGEPRGTFHFSIGASF